MQPNSSFPEMEDYFYVKEAQVKNSNNQKFQIKDILEQEGSVLIRQLISPQVVMDAAKKVENFIQNKLKQLNKDNSMHSLCNNTIKRFKAEKDTSHLGSEGPHKEQIRVLDEQDRAPEKEEISLLDEQDLAHQKELLEVLENQELFTIFDHVFSEQSVTLSHKWLRCVGKGKYTGTKSNLFTKVTFILKNPIGFQAFTWTKSISQNWRRKRSSRCGFPSRTRLNLTAP